MVTTRLELAGNCIFVEFHQRLKSLFANVELVLQQFLAYEGMTLADFPKGPIDGGKGWWAISYGYFIGILQRILFALSA